MEKEGEVPPVFTHSELLVHAFRDKESQSTESDDEDRTDDISIRDSVDEECCVCVPRHLLHLRLELGLDLLKGVLSKFGQGVLREQMTLLELALLIEDGISLACESC